MSHSISYIFYTVSCLETYSNEMTLCWIYVLHSQEMEIKEIQLVHRRLVGKIVGAAFQPRLSRLESRSHSEIEVDKKIKAEDFPTNPR